MQIVNSLAKGVNVTYWNGNQAPNGSWVGSSTPNAMQNLANYAAVAGNTDQKVFAIANGQILWYTVAEDGVTWSQMAGTVPTM